MRPVLILKTNLNITRQNNDYRCWCSSYHMKSKYIFMESIPKIPYNKVRGHKFHSPCLKIVFLLSNYITNFSAYLPSKCSTASVFYCWLYLNLIVGFAVFLTKDIMSGSNMTMFRHIEMHQPAAEIECAWLQSYRLVSNIRHLSRLLDCWYLICSWGIAWRRCFNCIFILDLTPDFNWLDKDNCKTRR